MKGLIFFLIVVFLSIVNTLKAQHSDSLTVQLYGEAYASFIPNKPFDNKRPAFHYNYTRANNAGINLALARIHYSKERFRTNFGLMAGDYAASNLADEEAWARNFYEANAGYKLSTQHELWLDVGLMPSHIGIETAIGRDNFTATRSIVADNSPYYETGVRFSYKPTDKWYMALLATTGWQNVTIPDGVNGLGWGLQFTYTPSSKLTLNHSSFIGDAIVNNRSGTRIYFNHYAAFALSNRSSLTLGWDIGFQENPLNVNETLIWNGVIGLYRYQLKPGKWSASFRYERFIDNKNVLFSIGAPQPTTFNVHHASANIDWQPLKGLLLRAEANYKHAPVPVFYNGTALVANQFGAFFIASYNFQYSKKR